MCRHRAEGGVDKGKSPAFPASRGCLLGSPLLADLQEEGSRETHEALGFPLQLSRDGLWQKVPQRGKAWSCVKTGSSPKCTEPVPAGLLCRPQQGKEVRGGEPCGGFKICLQSLLLSRGGAAFLSLE